MSPQTPSANDIDALWAAKRRAKKAKRRQRESEKSKLLINSLMDAFTIILCFLLKSFGSDPVQIRESDELKLARSSSESPLVDAVVIGISKRSIQVDDVKVADLRNGAVDESMKRDGQEGLLINPLYDKLKEKVQHLKMIAARSAQQQFKGLALVVADKETTYRLVTEVLYTAGQAEFEKFKFVAAEGGGPKK
ncbi:MAG: biopolymer transporter ExbD [Myxococcota bacterium]|nr:biopolymer transporter ExbD [Myxococcota bacterium]